VVEMIEKISRNGQIIKFTRGYKKLRCEHGKLSRKN
jgi:hypothetical protein